MTWNFSENSSLSQATLASQVIKLSQRMRGYSDKETFKDERDN